MRPARLLSCVEIRNRSGDIWLPHSRRYADLKQALVPMEAAQTISRLTMPFEPETWLADRKARLHEGLARLAKAARTGAIPGGSIENGILKIDRLTGAVPDEADAMVLDLYGRLPAVRIMRTGVPCKDRIGLLNVLLAEGLNLGLSKMAEATSSYDYFQLSRLSRWHIESDAINRALTIVIAAQSELPMTRHWGSGVTASSDRQFFSAARQGEAMNLINAKYGSEPGLKSLHPCVLSVRTVRDPEHPGDRERGSLRLGWFSDERGWPFLASATCHPSGSTFSTPQLRRMNCVE